MVIFTVVCPEKKEKIVIFAKIFNHASHQPERVQLNF